MGNVKVSKEKIYIFQCTKINSIYCTKFVVVLIPIKGMKKKYLCKGFLSFFKPAP